MNFFTCTLGQVPFRGVEEFPGLGLPLEQRLPEGPRIDYNEVITQDLGDDVAAFANCDGGLIFIGIKADKEKQNVPIAWPGLPERPDYGTRITSKVLSTVRPRPEFELGWATTPEGTYIYIVRVRTGTHPPYEYQQGNTVKISLRVHDGKRQATVRDIESLFNRRAEAGPNPETRVMEYLEAQNFNCTKATIVNGRETQEFDYDFQRIAIVPRAKASLSLDSRFATEFEMVLFRCFPDEPEGWDYEVRGEYLQVEAKRRGELPWHHLWRIYRNGALAYTGSLVGDFPGGKPIGDLASDLFSMCALAKQLLEKIEVYGDVHLGHLLRAPAATFLPKFPAIGAFGDYDTVGGIQIPSARKTIINQVHSLRVLDTSELASPVIHVSELLMYNLREIRGVRFDHKRLLEAISPLANRVRLRTS